MFEMIQLKKKKCVLIFKIPLYLLNPMYVNQMQLKFYKNR